MFDAKKLNNMIKITSNYLSKNEQTQTYNVTYKLTRNHKLVNYYRAPDNCPLGHKDRVKGKGNELNINESPEEKKPNASPRHFYALVYYKDGRQCRTLLFTIMEADPQVLRLDTFHVWDQDQDERLYIDFRIHYAVGRIYYKFSGSCRVTSHDPRRRSLPCARGFSLH